MQNSFLHRIVKELLSVSKDLSRYTLVLPGKRPVVFFKKVLEEQSYSGLLPTFISIEDLVVEIAQIQPIQGVAVWLMAYDIYKELYPEEFSDFIRWFPTLLKDWDDILKFAQSESEILEYMVAEERIRNWSEALGEKQSEARKRHLDFWKKMNCFLPILKAKLSEKGWATAGMIHEKAKKQIESFAQNTKEQFVFCGFNAFTPLEEQLVKVLLRYDKAYIFFQADAYYMEDERQEAGKFLRTYRKWNEFNTQKRQFTWIDRAFEKTKTIELYEVSGNVTQTKVAAQILDDLAPSSLNNTALVLLDEHLLPTSLESLTRVDKINITMGFPLKSLAFSQAVKQLFYIQKQQEKQKQSYYYKDVLSVLETLPNSEEDTVIIRRFQEEIVDKNMVYFSLKRLESLLGELSYFKLLVPAENSESYLEQLIDYCFQIKWLPLDNIQFENISHFEKIFKIIRNQITDYHFPIRIETLEVLINQIINLETIDFKGEPLEGLQVMGLLETRLLNFENVILLSVNEGKLPLGNTQNTYLPYEVRRLHGLHTFLENDSIYAYHFYRLLQEAQHIHLLYNVHASGVNTGEKSRFITQIEMESPHQPQKWIVENSSEPQVFENMQISKTPSVLEKLEVWKEKVSASHLTTYLYDPVQFYMNYILKVKETKEIEEELSQRNYGNLVHFSLQILLEKVKGKILNPEDIEKLLEQVDDALLEAIAQLKHQPEFYARGMNFIHKSIAQKIIESILNYDLQLVKAGHSLEILDLERKIANIEFPLNEQHRTGVKFYGYIDRIDRLDGKIRVIDYKTGKAKNLSLKFVSRGEDRTEELLMDEKYKQALQLCIYLYYAQKDAQLSKFPIEAGIWSFAQVQKGVQTLAFSDGDLQTAMISIKNLILEILNPEIPFEETLKEDYYNS